MVSYGDMVMATVGGFCGYVGDGFHNVVSNSLSDASYDSVCDDFPRCSLI